MSIKENLLQLQKTISLCQEKYSVNQDINIIAVSKTKPVEAIEQAISAGQLVFGENKIQEAVEKIPQISHPGLQWHFIGHLQRNKVKKAVELFDVIQSVDKYDTAQEISKRCTAIDKLMPIFLQVNTTDEDQKSGVSPENLEKLVEEVKELTNIKIIGLMTIGLFTDDEDEVRKSFRLLRTLKDEMNQKYPSLEIHYLSMGMSGDYEIAIQEGATHIRVGTSIFGVR